jgi:transcriptional regulator with XRE-family HTH domain
LLAVARRARSVKQGDLAQRLGTSPAALSRIEHGGNPRASTFFEIARALRYEPLLVPKEHVPAVRALLRSLTEGKEEPEQRPRFS